MTQRNELILKLAEMKCAWKLAALTDLADANNICRKIWKFQEQHAITLKENRLANEESWKRARLPDVCLKEGKWQYRSNGTE